jgi:hypothetical protein
VRWIFFALAAVCSAILLVTRVAEEDWVGALVAAIGMAACATAVVRIRREHI